MADHPSLSGAARRALAAAEDVFISAVVPWEIEIKRAVRRVDAPVDLESRLDRCGFRPLPITFAHAVAAGRLPPLHSDPFDRMLVAQAGTESLTLVTSDQRIGRYGVAVLAAS